MPFLQNQEMSKAKAMKSRYRRISLVLLFVVALTIPLYAQMKIEKTEPVANSTNHIPPPQIQIWFNEAPVYGFTKINLAGPTGGVKLATLVFDGKSVSAAVVGVLANGAYVATWRSVGNAGHVQRGQFKFAVKTK
jgi:methionine-rich copper-binding protein CopC